MKRIEVRFEARADFRVAHRGDSGSRVARPVEKGPKKVRGRVGSRPLASCRSRRGPARPRRDPGIRGSKCEFEASLRWTWPEKEGFGRVEEVGLAGWEKGSGPRIRVQRKCTSNGLAEEAASVMYLLTGEACQATVTRP